MKVKISETVCPTEVVIKEGNLVVTERGNLLLVTGAKGPSEFSGLCLSSKGVLEVGRHCSGLKTFGVSLFKGSVTITNGV